MAQCMTLKVADMERMQVHTLKALAELDFDFGKLAFVYMLGIRIVQSCSHQRWH